MPQYTSCNNFEYNRLGYNEEGYPIGYKLKTPENKAREKAYFEHIEKEQEVKREFMERSKIVKEESKMSKFKKGDTARFCCTGYNLFGMRYNEEVRVYDIVHKPADGDYLRVTRSDSITTDWLKEDWFSLVSPPKSIYHWCAFGGDNGYAKFDTDFDIRDEIMNGASWVRSIVGNVYNLNYYSEIQLQSTSEEDSK